MVSSYWANKSQIWMARRMVLPYLQNKGLEDGFLTLCYIKIMIYSPLSKSWNCSGVLRPVGRDDAQFCDKFRKV